PSNRRKEIAILHHIALTAADLPRSAVFYDAILTPMGYRRVSSSDRVSAWQGPGTEIILYAATPEQRNNAHRTYDPGIHHLAFQLDNRASVAEVLKRALESGGRLLEDARLYPHYEP